MVYVIWKLQLNFNALNNKYTWEIRFAFLFLSNWYLEGYANSIADINGSWIGISASNVKS